MPYSLHNRNSREDFRGGRNILASVHLQFIEAGATLDAEAFGAGYFGVGTLVAQNTATGKYEPVADRLDLDGFVNPGIANVDFDCDGVNDIILGELIVRGSVYEQKLADEVPAFFKEANPLIRYVNEL